ncbi:MAG TPA: hypothetical protein VFJ58_27495, partial [Armatimonadota bacterium]|nr:hypothetical protein [Armatimonadota bacterium]
VTGANLGQAIPPSMDPGNGVIAATPAEGSTCELAVEAGGGVALGPIAAVGATIVTVGTTYYNLWQNQIKPWMKDCADGMGNEASNPPNLFGSDPNGPNYNNSGW